jgi:hypothetical protein
MGLASKNCIFASRSAARAGRERNLGGISFQILGSGGIIDRSEKVRN